MGATRREFLHDAALAGMTAMVASRFGSLAAAQAGGAPWQSRIGLELYTVRDLMAADYVGVLEKVAAVGYKEIEPAGGYNNLSPKDFRALLDRLGLSMPSTHSGTSGTGLELEKRPNARVSSMTFVPVGVGDIDFKKVFANAALAGLKHFAIEQDNAATWGDSLSAARISYQNMKTLLS